MQNDKRENELRHLATQIFAGIGEIEDARLEKALDVVGQVVELLGKDAHDRHVAARIAAQMPENSKDAEAVIAFVRELQDWTSAPKTRRHSLRRVSGFAKTDP